MLNKTDLSRTDLNLLVLFEVVLEQRHVGRAARQLNLSESAVSHGLRRLRRLLKDPLFLRTPKGVVPTARALELAEPINEILARVRNVVANAEPFEAASSTRRFIIGSPDGLPAVFLRSLFASVSRVAPSIDIGVRELLSPSAARSAAHMWEPAFAELDARTIDIAVLPLADVPSRFDARTLYEDDFIIAMRREHPFARAPTLKRFCEMPHLLVSLAGDAFGFVDEALAHQGLSRRIALTVPNFMLALAMIAETELIAAVPRQLVVHHARRFNVIGVESPIELPHFRICSVVPEAATRDAGVAWLLDQLREAAQAGRAIQTKRRRC